MSQTSPPAADAALWSHMTLEQAAGQLLIAGFDGAQPTPPPAIAQALASGHLSGVILFRRNIHDIEQLVALNTALHEAAAQAPMAPLISVDQEGGRVVRVRTPLTPLPPLRALGQTRQPKLVAQASEVIATELQAIGFNLNYSPVLDVDTNPANPVIGDRALSSSSTWVGRLGGAFVGGHVIAGVIPCGKHFPGHGDTHQDSHLALPTILHSVERLERVELPPFVMAARAGLPMIMTAHLVVASLDPVYPATLSPAVIQGLLRDKLGFQGVVITDCLEMKAVADHHPIEALVERSLMAGVDLFLISHTEERWRRAHAHLVERARQDPALRARLYQSMTRVARLKDGFLGHMERPWRPAPGWRDALGTPEHHALMRRILDAAAAHDPTSPAASIDPTEA